MAVLVFLFFPRGAGPTLFGPMQASPSQALSGFNDQVSFQDVAHITRSEDVVARVELYHNNQKITHPTELLLHADQSPMNTPAMTSAAVEWLWTRSHPRRN